MSERLLDAFREEAEALTAVPPFELIEQRGRRRRNRRRAAAIGGVLACVLAVTTTVVLRDALPQAEQPATPGESSSQATPFPGNSMTTLEAGTYDLNPRYTAGGPQVRVRLPEGWNAWESPNRFEGVGAPGESNEDALGRTTWYMGMRALEVDEVAARGCGRTDVSGDPAALAEALAEIPQVTVLSGPDTTTRSGYAAVHLRLRQTRVAAACHGDHLFETVGIRAAGFGEAGETFDAWVVDVDGESVLVWSAWTRRTPREEVRGLLEIIDSMEIIAGQP